MREATNSKLRVNVSFSPSTAALQQSIALVWPQLEKQRTLRKNFQLLEGLMVRGWQGGGMQG
jgi:Bardet-Biedl syndrome 7 protein